MKSLSFSKSRKFWFIFAAIIVFAVAICFASFGIAQAQNGSSKSRPEKVANEAIVCVKSVATNTGDNNSQNNMQNSQQTLGEGDQISGATISKKLTSAPLGINVETDIAEGGNNIINSVEKDNAQSSINSTQQNQINSTNSQNTQTAETCEIYLVNCNNVDSYCSNATNDENVIWAQPNYYYYLPEDNSDKAIDADDETNTSADDEKTSTNDAAATDNSAIITQNNTPNTYQNDDPLFNNQWGFDGTASGNNCSIDADAAWKNSSSTNYTENVVAVIDTGVDYDHEDISANMWNKGTSYSKLTALGGGTYGINTTSSGSSADPGNDQVGHGTHCASAVSTVNNNATGLCGVANNHTKIMGCKVFKVSSSGGASATTEDIVEAYNYVIVAKESGVNLSACSCSFGNSDVTQKYDYALNSMIVNAGKKGVVSVYSAGNDARDMEGYTGSIHSNPYTIEVGASNDVGEAAVFSNYGQHSINVFAPGVEMLACASSDANIGSYLPWAQDASNNWYYEQFNNSSGGISFCKLNGSTMQDVTSTISDGKAKIDMSSFKTSDDNYLFAKIPKANLSSLLSAGKQPYIAFGCDFTNCGFVDEHVGLYTWDGSEKSYLYDYYCNASLRTGSHASILSNQALQAVDDYVYIGFKFQLRDKSTNPTFNLDCLGFGKSASNYTYMQGTSMATPVVSGMVGYVSSLLGATSTSADALKLVAHITGSTVDKTTLNDKCVTGGVVNLNKAISGISGVSTSQSHNPVMQSATFSTSGNTITATINGYFFGSAKGSVAVDGASSQVVSWSDNQVIITFNSVEQHLGEFIMTTSDSRVGRNYLDIAVENKGYTSLSTSDVEYTDKWSHTYTSNDLNVLRTATTNNAMYTLFGANEAGITVLEKYDYSTGKWSSISTSSLTNFVQLGTAGTYSLACGYSEIYLLYPSGTSDNYTMRLATYSETQQKFIYDKSLGSKATPGDMLCNVNGKLWLAGYDYESWAWSYNKPRSSHIMVVYPDTGELGDSVGNFPTYISAGNMSVCGDNVVVSDASYVYYGTDPLDPYYCNINSASTWKTPTTSLYTDITKSFTQYNTSAGVATSAGILEVGMVTNNAKANMVDHYMEGYNTLNWSAVSNVRFATYKCLAVAAVCHDNKLYVIANDGLGGGMSFKYMNLSSIGATADSVNTLAERKDASIPVKSINLNKPELYLSVDESEQLTYSVLPTNASTAGFKWTTSEESVCTVDNTGKVTAISKGQATITLSSSDGSVKATCTVYVSGPLVENGVYYIASSGNVTQVIDVAGGSKANAANVQIYQANQTNAQKWKVENKDDSYVVLRNVGSNRVIDVAGGSKSAGANIWQYDANGSDAQLWKPQINGDGTITFRSKLNDNLVIDLAAGSTANGTNVQTYTWNKSAAQKFRLYNLSPFIEPSGVEVDEGYYCIQSKKDANYYVDLDAGSSANGTNIHLWSGTAGSNDNQIFYFKKTSDGFYEITNCNTKKAIDVSACCVLPGTNVLQWQCNQTAAQKWNLLSNSDGSFSLQNAGTGLIMDVSGGNMLNGSNIQGYLFNGTAAQKWKLIDTKPMRVRLDELAQAHKGVITEGTYAISVSANGNYVLDVASGSKSDGANIQLYSSNKSAAQKWKVSYDTTGYMTLTNVGSNKVLDVAGGTASAGTNVWQYTSNGSYAQKWIAVPVNSADSTIKFQLISGLKDTLQLGSASSRIVNGTNIQLVSSSTASCNLFSVDTTPTGGTKEITTSEDITSGSFSSTTSDQNTIYAHGSLTSNISNITANKTGDTTNEENANFYGINSAILAKAKANLIIKNSTITTNASGANGLFVYGGLVTNGTGDGSSATIGSSKITTSGDNSGGIMVAGGGILKALTGMIVKTSGRSSAAIRSDRGGGSMTITEGEYTTNGAGSPAIYCTADISATGSKLTSNKSEGVVIEGANSTSLNGCELVDNNSELAGQSTSYKNVFIYQSMSGDARTGTGTFTAKDSSITTKKGDSFYVTNTDAVINLENNTITNTDTTGNLLRIKKDAWGKTGENGGNVTFNLTNQAVSGNIVVDSISTLVMSMKSGSTYTGTINADKTAKSLSLSLSSDSRIVLKGSSYVSSFSDDDASLSNIDNSNGHLYKTDGTLIK